MRSAPFVIDLRSSVNRIGQGKLGALSAIRLDQTFDLRRAPESFRLREDHSAFAPLEKAFRLHSSQRAAEALGGDAEHPRQILILYRREQFTFSPDAIRRRAVAALRPEHLPDQLLQARAERETPSLRQTDPAGVVLPAEGVKDLPEESQVGFDQRGERLGADPTNTTQ